VTVSRPFVYVNMAMTADGKITSSQREYPRFASSDDRLRMDRLRAEADALLVGAGTIRADDPALHVRSAEMAAHRAKLGRPPELIRVIATRSLDLPADCRFFEDDGARRILATIESAPAERLARLGARAEIWTVGADRLDLTALLARLAEAGVERLLVEGGAELNGSLLISDLIDEVYFTITPALLGGRDAPTPIGGPGFSMSGQRRLELLEVDRVGDELFTRWKIVR